MSKKKTIDANKNEITCFYGKPGTESPPIYIKKEKEFDRPGFDFVIFSLSRYNELETCITSLKENLKNADNVRFHLWNGYFAKAKPKLPYNNDYYSKAAAKRCIELAQKHKFATIVSIEAEHSLGYAMTNAMNNVIDSKYMITFLDDGRLVKELDVSQIYAVLEQNDKINHISVNHRAAYPCNVLVDVKMNETMKKFPGSKHFYFSGLSFWRMSFMKKNWVGYWRNVHHGFNIHMSHQRDYPYPKLREKYEKPKDHQFFTKWDEIYQQKQDYIALVLGAISWDLQWDPEICKGVIYCVHSDHTSVRTTNGL